LRAKASASDLVQESGLEAYRDFAQFRGETAQALKEWLKRILLNNLRDLIRRFRGAEMREAAREQPLEGGTGEEHDPAATTASPSEQAIQQEELERMRHALSGLPEDQRQVVHLRHQEQLSWEEIGRRMNRSADASRKLWARAVKRLGEFMGESHDRR